MKENIDNFFGVALVSRQIKAAFRLGEGFKELNAEEHEALDMIAHYIAHIVVHDHTKEKKKELVELWKNIGKFSYYGEFSVKRDLPMIPKKEESHETEQSGDL